MSTDHAPSSPDLVEATESLLPIVSARAAETERGRRVPPDLVAALVAGGCFRVVLPERQGGTESDFPAAMRMFEAIAGADASTAWTVAIGAASWVDLAALPVPTFDALYATGGDVITAGAFNPTGMATPAAGGFSVDGRWAFASGCQHATWLYGNCIEPTESGGRVRTVLFSPADVVIEDTWDAVGLRGTGSHHFHVDGITVDATRTRLALEDEPQIDTPIVRIPAPSLFALGLASVALGTAQGALDEVVGLATGKVPLLGTSTLTENALFQFGLGSACTRLAAARSLIYERAEAAWSTAVDGIPFTLMQRAELRAAAAWATCESAAVVDAAYTAGGSTVVYTDSSLQRRLRDIHAITQHFLLKADTLTAAGAVFAGLDTEPMVF